MDLMCTRTTGGQLQLIVDERRKRIQLYNSAFQILRGSPRVFISSKSGYRDSVELFVWILNLHEIGIIGDRVGSNFFDPNQYIFSLAKICLEDKKHKRIALSWQRQIYIGIKENEL
ncbi:hypothetical protein WICPIJ_008818 [Wickerhamomyces pijperi]|uniref:Uncharacterized protein n=1 Tax=Wickerhamomyces pijperi TaxID=599730 RepID=A0A9P8PV06_WICPI|nr:hypothetical protein WICPIJ_008818 [Wickerhamomyces pijperi]